GSGGGGGGAASGSAGGGAASGSAGAGGGPAVTCSPTGVDALQDTFGGDAIDLRKWNVLVQDGATAGVREGELVFGIPELVQRSYASIDSVARYDLVNCEI